MLRRAARTSLAVVGVLLLLLAVAGCADDDEELPVACEAPAQTVLQALEAAPDAVTIGGERLSTCLDRAVTSGEIKRFGVGITDAAAELAPAAARDPRLALQLGYLVGAMRRGRSVIGIHDELVRRIEGFVPGRRLTPAARAAFRRGLEAGTTAG